MVHMHEIFGRPYEYEIYYTHVRGNDLQLSVFVPGDKEPAPGNHIRGLEIGTLGAVIVGIVLFKEPVTAARIFFVSLLLIGIVGLKATSGH